MHCKCIGRYCMFGKEILKLVLYLFILSVTLERRFVQFRGTTDKRKWRDESQRFSTNRCDRHKSVNCSRCSTKYASSFLHNAFAYSMSQRQNSLLIIEEDVNDGNSCNGALLARVNSSIMKLFQWCCYFKWTLKNWLFWRLQVFFWFSVDSFGF